MVQMGLRELLATGPLDRFKISKGLYFWGVGGSGNDISVYVTKSKRIIIEVNKETSALCAAEVCMWFVGGGRAVAAEV